MKRKESQAGVGGTQMSMLAPEQVGCAGCGPRLAWPPDPMTRLMMAADGVTEVELDDLLRKVAAVRVKQ
jgi:hypothetical protein